MTTATSAPPIPIAEVRTRIDQAIKMRWDEVREMLGTLYEDAPAYWKQHLELQHSIPGPSSATDCMRQLQFKVRGIEADKELPDSWLMAAATGIMLEPFWYAILELTGLNVERLDEPLEVTPSIMGSHDGMFRNLEPRTLLELKALGMWPFIFTWKKGVREESHGHWLQAQAYMEAGEANWCLYLAAARDPAAVSWLLRKWYTKDLIKQEIDPSDLAAMPWYHLEWIPREDGRGVSESLGAAQRVILSDEQAPRRTVDGRMLSPGSDEWPCGKGCRWIERCVQTGG